MQKRRIIIGTAIAAVVIALLAFVMMRLAGSDMPVLQPKGIIAREQRDLLIISTLLMLIVVIPVFILTFLIAWRYRASNKQAEYRPNWDHSKILEVIWWGVPVIIIAILAVLTWTTSHTLDPYRKLSSQTEPVKVQVVALQWKWLFIYPDNGVASVNELVIPEDTPINFEITSDAPMNSFWIPSLAGQVYAMSGMTTKLHVMADDPGEYRGSSANISGEGFAGMNFKVRALTSGDYQQWLHSIDLSKPLLNEASYEELAKPSKNVKPSSYTLDDIGLYEKVVMKYMMPEHKDEGGHHE